MNAQIQSRLDALSTALTTLLDSISSYNPSIPATSALLAADADLQRSLKALHTHQKNVARIEALRLEIEKRNEEITNDLTALVDVRKDLLSIPTSLPQKGRRDVDYKSLLAYATHIARTSVPPTHRPPVQNPPLAPPQASAAHEPNADGGTTITAATTTTTMAEANTGAANEGRGTTALEASEREWLDPLRRMDWVPWVDEEMMRRGALAEIQSMVERGEDPVRVGVGVSVGGEVEGEEREGSAGEGAREEVVGPPTAREEDGAVVQRVEKDEKKPVVFGGLDLYDPDEDD
ncbi:hypothetical protein MMC21_003182 [Puttea exsequens]|nr:hypothetical protein [Puttea exsequens]